MNISNFILRKTAAIVHLVDLLHVTSYRLVLVFSHQMEAVNNTIAIVSETTFVRQSSSIENLFFYCAYNIRTNVSSLAHILKVTDLYINKHVWAQQMCINFKMHACTNVQFCNVKIKWLGFGTIICFKIDITNLQIGNSFLCFHWFLIFFALINIGL